MNDFIYISKEDNVATALRPLSKGMRLETPRGDVTLVSDIPTGHKFALKNISAGENVIKYGIAIGSMTCDAKKGEWIHIHNIKSNLEGLLDYKYSGCTVKDTPKRTDTFFGYIRKDGRVGTRNELWIIPTVACVNHTVNESAERARAIYGDRCDGIWAVPHNTGCSQLGEDADISHNILNGIILHPNAGGVLLVSLGCENANLDTILPSLGDYDKSRIKHMVTQDIEGDEIEYGLKLVGEICNEIEKDKRTEVPVSKLVLGLKCGGSDAFSGLTANPLVGSITDKVVENDGIAIFTEVSEVFGAEQFLMNRASDEKTFNKIVNLINSFKKYYMDYGLPIYENPSPGNKEGGISTDEEKSMGNIQKSGKLKVTDVLSYGEQAVKPGVNFLEGPGNDSVSITNVLASGATILLFTTGRGNPLGTLIPTVKISSNSYLAKNKPHWIDFDAGEILEDVSFEELSDKLWSLVLDIASGREKSKGEENGFRDVMVFKKGVLL